jgi:hypothetical protein
MMVVVGQQLVAQLGIVGELPIEAKAEPLVFLQVVSLKRLGVVQVILAACSVSNVTDGGPANHSRHDAFSLAVVAQVENFAYRTDAAVRVE